MTEFNRGIRKASLGLLLASGIAVASFTPALAQSTFGALDGSNGAKVQFSSADEGQPILAGSVVKVSGEGFRPSQQVQLLYGTTPIDGGALHADAEGKIDGRITVPNNAISGSHPIVIVAQAPYAASVTDLKVSPTIPLSGQKNFVIAEAHATQGLYQSAYSTKSNAVFVASAIGRPPVSKSELVKIDADSLKVLARITPAEAPASRGREGGAPGGPRAGGNGQAPGAPSVYAVYGLAVDDAKGTVWATNTRQNTVAVYQQSDLKLVKQFAPDTVAHPRDARVDASLGKAYVSSTGKPEVVVLDTGALTVANTIKISSKARGKEFSATSLSLDTTAHRLYVASLSTNEVAVIDTQKDEVSKVFAVPGAKGAIGVSHDPQTGRIYVASQGSDNLVVLDGNSGAVIANTPVGAGALNVVFDPVKRLAYVSNRGAGTIAVTDADGKLVANLGPAPQANHVSLGKNGTVFAVDKSAKARNADTDAVLRIRPVK